MNIAAFMLAVLAPAASSATQPAPSPAPSVTASSPGSEICPGDLHHYASAASAQARRLGELPPGDLQLTVIRRGADGCYEPVIVRQGFGAVGDPRRR